MAYGRETLTTNTLPSPSYSPLVRVRLQVRNNEPSSNFVVHFNARDKAAMEYKTKLPVGMAASQKHDQWIKPTLATTSSVRCWLTHSILGVPVAT